MLKMSGHSLPAMSSLLILSILLPFSLFISSSEAASCNSVYWGRNAAEGSLQTICARVFPLYRYLIIDYLNVSGVLDLDGHCDSASGSCTKFASEIKFCQERGIKVLLSLDSRFGEYPPGVADLVAKNLHEEFLSGNPGPLGKVVLDGIDFYIPNTDSTKFWAELAKALSKYTTEKGKVYLSAAPKCSLLDLNSDVAIKTGLFDYVWPRFYNSPSCDISAGVSGLLESWKDWSSYLAKYSPNSQLYIGLPASPDAARSGYIDLNVLFPEIFPTLWSTTNYGGVMLWNVYYDNLDLYSVRGVAAVSCNPLRSPPSGSRVHKELSISQVV